MDYTDKVGYPMAESNPDEVDMVSFVMDRRRSAVNDNRSTKKLSHLKISLLVLCLAASSIVFWLI